MPRVTVQSNSQTPEGFFRKKWGEFGYELQKLVAEALTCEGGELKWNDVEIIFTKVDRANHLGYKDLEVIVVANDYPERRANLDHRRGQIVLGLQKLMRHHTTKGQMRSWSVWVQLVTASYEDNRS